MSSSTFLPPIVTSHLFSSMSNLIFTLRQYSSFLVTTPPSSGTGVHSSLESEARLMAIEAGSPSQKLPVQSIPTPTMAPVFPTKPRGPEPSNERSQPATAVHKIDAQPLATTLTGGLGLH